ncbi:hypothetical protein GCM10017783_23260 [Deinococcus piscis]|uniref:N-acetyltransferase domain-containing protein n=1 Tax=Deinococcus piscis TaxID=394230 RepID=A0ABQ3KAI2_9DEIO|nr:arsenic resistance N-acetyltransferase ArsN2 [Deinococcus piscis]GHG10105.1 hypothetical protein GCM10017783_23260 [Deinococcus piscis]
MTVQRWMQTSDLAAVRAFLQAQGLPVDGLMTGRGGVLLAEQGGELVGTVGVEIYGRLGLLRSVAVLEAYRSQGLGEQLVRQALAYAAKYGLSDLYLLTTTAENYFPRFGFRAISRLQAPTELQASAEFQGACPQSASLMHLSLETFSTPLTLPTDQHTTASFLETLCRAPAVPLEFRLNGNTLVPAGYHVTEIKAVTVDSVDCGGRKNAWQGTVVQLMDGTPAEARQGFMLTQKFLDIYDRVSGQIPVQDAAVLRFEYGNLSTPAMQYHFMGVEVQAARVVAEVQPPGVMCKATGVSSTQGQCCGSPDSA